MPTALSSRAIEPAIASSVMMNVARAIERATTSLMARGFTSAARGAISLRMRRMAGSNCIGSPRRFHRPHRFVHWFRAEHRFRRGLVESLRAQFRNHANDAIVLIHVVLVADCDSLPDRVLAGPHAIGERARGD